MSNKLSQLAFLTLSHQAAVDNYLHSDKKRRDAWEEWELDIIRHYYAKRGPEYCQSKLKTRTLYSIFHKARELGIKRKNYACWQQSEIDIVVKGIVDEKPVQAIVDDLAQHGYTRTYVSVRDCRIMLKKRYNSSIYTSQASL